MSINPSRKKTLQKKSHNGPGVQRRTHCMWSFKGDVSLNSAAVDRSGKIDAKPKQYRRSSRKSSTKDTTLVQEATEPYTASEAVNPKPLGTATQRKRKCRVRAIQKKKRKKNRPDAQEITLASDHFLNSLLPENCAVQSGFDVQESYGLAPKRYDVYKLTLADRSTFDTRATCMANYAQTTLRISFNGCIIVR